MGSRAALRLKLSAMSCIAVALLVGEDTCGVILTPGWLHSLDSVASGSGSNTSSTACAICPAHHATSLRQTHIEFLAVSCVGWSVGSRNCRHLYVTTIVHRVTSEMCSTRVPIGEHSKLSRATGPVSLTPDLETLSTDEMSACKGKSALQLSFGCTS